MVKLLISQDSVADALAYAEGAKGRVLHDVLRHGKMNVTKTIMAAEREEER